MTSVATSTTTVLDPRSGSSSSSSSVGTTATTGPKIIRDADDTVENYTLYIGGERFQVNDFT